MCLSVYLVLFENPAHCKANINIMHIFSACQTNEQSMKYLTKKQNKKRLFCFTWLTLKKVSKRAEYTYFAHCWARERKRHDEISMNVSLCLLLTSKQCTCRERVEDPRTIFIGVDDAAKIYLGQERFWFLEN